MAIADLIREAGVVGCGGAGFPTHAKLKGPIEYYIVNGAECEPLLRTDRYIMTHHAPELVEALTALHRRCADVRYLGSWPTGDVVGAAPPPMDESASWLEGLREGRP